MLLTPLAVETFGRRGKLAAKELKRLARARATLPDATASVDSSAVFRGALLRWRRELSVCLQLNNAQAMAHCAGRVELRGAHSPPEAVDSPAELMLER